MGERLNNTAYDNIQPRQRSSPNTGCSTKASPDLNEGPTPTYLIGSSSFLTEIPVAEGGQRMLLAYKLCTRASSEECSNIGALEKSARCNGHFLLFPSFLYVFLSLFSVSRQLFFLGFSAAERRPPPSLTGVAEIILSDSSSCTNALCCLQQPSLQAVTLSPQCSTRALIDTHIRKSWANWTRMIYYHCQIGGELEKTSTPLLQDLIHKSWFGVTRLRMNAPHEGRGRHTSVNGFVVSYKLCHYVY